MTNPINAYAADTAGGPLAGSPGGSLSAIDQMLAFSARHSIAPMTETFPLAKVNDALEHLPAGKARYRIVLVNEPA